MQNAEVTIHHEAGLHARPAALFVKTANRYQSQISLSVGERKVNAKSIVQVLTLGVKQGTTLAISAEGADEAEAVEALSTLVQSNFATE